MFPKRVTLDPGTSFTYTSKKAIEDTWMVPEMRDATKVLEANVKAAGGTFKLNSVYRSWEKQQKLRDAYEAYDKLTAEEKAKVPFVALAAPPGASWHMAGRALDVDVKNLNFPGVPHDQQLQKFWDIAKPLGFRPIIDKPDLSTSECWHFDFCGPWNKVRLLYGYGYAAKCAMLDIGNWNAKESESRVKNMFIQAQLVRLGHNLGDIDGILGLKSKTAMKAEGIDKLSIDEVIASLIKKP